ncbi:hypothetical protein D917_08599 [Trichinella nativa]|uniref:Uncharacterized protein n=1 Tax=Trichinella nativa TaxID=6335 RepID=A0A1Y3ENP2_9BILA|nr:hypothetical protein D917_08599 [Trichinella nativa]
MSQCSLYCCMHFPKLLPEHLFPTTKKNSVHYKYRACALRNFKIS